MIKQTTVLLLLFVLTFSKYVVNKQPGFVGGYKQLDLNNANEDPELYRELQSVVQFARTEYQKQSNDEPLGRLMSVSRQLVAGFNYKLTFQHNGEQVQITVFDQSWTQTRQITSVRVVEKKE